jgi:hypothetical protein
MTTLVGEARDGGEKNGLAAGSDVTAADPERK